MSKGLEQYSHEKEKEIIQLWEKEKIREKFLKLNKNSKKTFYMMDGPPYATGSIHMGTALNKILKDISIRSQNMQGLNVFARPGYDTHGLPIEHKVEKQLGFKTKEEIEAYGIEKFVKECKNFATKFIDTMNSEFNDLGSWFDWDNPYITLENEYIESLWWTFKKAEEKNLLFLGNYSVHVCPRCVTAVAYNEIEYSKQTDESVFVKFPVKNLENTFLIIWTTTPWTLPGNTGVMVHPKYDYSFVKLSSGETLIIASELAEKLMNALEAGFKIEKTVKGKELEGMQYENPLTKHMQLPKLENAYRVILSERYVNLDEGSGLVHTAPGHGKEDWEAGTKNNLPIIVPVEMNGSLKKETGKYAGKKARIVDKEIIKDLEESGNLLYKHPYTHDYPLCWRCDSPLIMLATPQWFLKVSDLRQKLLKENEKTNWTPKWMKDRMKNWIESLSDWPISRNRYWGTPLPIWLCDSCNHRLVIGSIQDLPKHAKIPKNLDLHKPYIDEIKFPCKKCNEKGTMTRVPEVLDVWFDSSATSWAALNYPKKQELFEKFWPANLNIEGTDQIRGWWNSQLIASIICFDKAPFENISTHGMVLDLSKIKMSKSKGNIVTPKEVIEKYNRDYLRFYLAKISKGSDMKFSWDDLKDIHRFFNILFNTVNFVSLYLDVKLNDGKIKEKLEPEDLWILSKTNSLTEQVTNAYNSFTFYNAVNALEQFIMEDLSRTYIKLIRPRINSDSHEAASQTLGYCINVVLKLLAPIAPHASEFVFKNFSNESIHLQHFAELNKKFSDKKIEHEMDLVKDLSQTVLSLRSENNLRLRWLLESVAVQNISLPKLKNVLAKMCNVRKVTETKSKLKGKFAQKEFNKGIVYLNLDTPDELKEEWEFRELVRLVQDSRKKSGLNPNDIVELNLGSSDVNFLKKFSKELEKETNTKIIQVSEKGEKLLEKQFFVQIGKKVN